MPTDQIKSSIPLNINDNNNNLDSPSPSSSYCLLTNGDLHFYLILIQIMVQILY